MPPCLFCIPPPLGILTSNSSFCSAAADGSGSEMDDDYLEGGCTSKAASLPLCLLDLDDDVLGLIAAHCWANGHAAGLIGACRRTRQVGMGALTRLRLSCCDGWDRPERKDTEEGEAVAAFSGPHFRFLATCLPSLRSFLCCATDVHEVWLSDGRACMAESEHCRQPRAAKERVWRAAGVALRDTPLVSVSVFGLAAMAALTNSDGPPCNALRTLRLERMADEDTKQVQLRALLQKAASSLECLGMKGWSLKETVGSIADVRPLSALRELSLGNEFDMHLFQVLGPSEATTIAAVCPRLTALRLCMRFGRGFGRAWAATRGRLEYLRTLHIHALRDSPATLSSELADLLAGRRLDELELTAFFFEFEDVVGAVLCCDRLPATLRIDPLNVPCFDFLLLCQDYRAAEDLAVLSLPKMNHPEVFLLGMGSLCQMRSLELAFDTRDMDVELLRSGIWVVPPRLRHLTVAVYSPHSAAGPGPPSALPLVAWMARCIADSPCAATLLVLALHARVPPEQPLQDALSPLASASMLRAVNVGVQPISNDGVGKQARLQNHLSALLPLAKVRVSAFIYRYSSS